MRARAPFLPADLEELDDRLLAEAVAVVPMRDVAAGSTWERVIGLRHDVDNIIEPAVKFAAWEADRGYRSTYYILHTAPYWKDKELLARSVYMIAELGHEIGIHNNAIAEASTTGADPRLLLAAAIDELRGLGVNVSGTVAHGDTRCYGPDGKVRFVNDEMFRECARPKLGDHDRTVADVKLRPSALSDFGLDYDANWLPRAHYLSDSGGQWRPDFDETAAGFPFDGQTHLLVHPDWWPKAFEPVAVA